MTKKDIAEEIRKAVEVLRKGGIILYPTDTIWGLGCDASNADAVANIYEIKQRPDSKSLVLLASDMDMIARNVQAIPNIAIDLVEVNDKPMTIIYPDALCDGYHLAPNVAAEDGSVGIRIPLTESCKDLVHRFGRPIVSTSANISGEPAPQTYEDIPEEIINAVDLVMAPALEKESTGIPSQIFKLGMDGTIKIIRP